MRLESEKPVGQFLVGQVLGGIPVVAVEKRPAPGEHPRRGFLVDCEDFDEGLVELGKLQVAAAVFVVLLEELLHLVRLCAHVRETSEDLQSLPEHELDVVRLLICCDPGWGLRQRPKSGHSVETVIRCAVVLEFPRGLDELFEVFIVLYGAADAAVVVDEFVLRDGAALVVVPLLGEFHNRLLLGDFAGKNVGVQTDVVNLHQVFHGHATVIVLVEHPPRLLHKLEALDPVPRPRSHDAGYRCSARLPKLCQTRPKNCRVFDLFRVGISDRRRAPSRVPFVGLALGGWSEATREH